MLNFNKRVQRARSDLVVREVAEKGATSTLSQLSPAAARMSSAELLGYARAHAWPLISSEIHQFATSSGLSEDQTNELLGRALEQTAHLVRQAYLAAPTVAIPTPHIGSRAAA